MKQKRKNTLAETLASRPITAANFGMTAHPKDGDAVQVVVPGQAAEYMHPAMAGASGQVINMAFNTPSPHLTFKEWMARGVVGGIGKVLAFPFAFIGNIINAIGLAAVGLLKMIALIILVPTLLWLGIMLMHKLSQTESIEEGAAMIATDAKRAASGVGEGLTREIPAKPPRPQSE